MRSITAKAFAFGAGAFAALALAANASQQPDFRDAGRAPATTPVRLAVTLAYRNHAELDALVHAQADPKSPLFRHYLSNSEFNASFAPSQAQHDRVEQVLRGAGRGGRVVDADE